MAAAQNMGSSAPEYSRARIAVVFALAMLLGICAAVTTGYFLAKPRAQDKDKNDNPKLESGQPADFKDFVAKHFANWPAGRKPDVVLVLSGEQHGYIQPCGCTKPLIGGLERRYNFIKLLRDNGLQVVAADLGDMYAPEKLREQAMMKFGLTLKALTLMDYSAICVGEQEFRIPLVEGLANTVLNDKPSFKILAANVKNKDAFVDLVEDGTVTNTNVKVGIVGVIGKSVETQVLKFDQTPKFGENWKVLPEVIGKQNADIRVLLYQGSHEEAQNLLKEMPKVAPNAPLPHVILCLSPDPSEETTIIGNSQIARVGPKGKHLGVFGIFRDPDGSMTLKYNQVKLDDEFETPKDKADDNPVMKLLEAYTKEVKDKKLINQWPRITHEMQVRFAKEKVAYVGSEACKDCHVAEYQKWDTTKHSDAFTALENAKRPSNRQFDGECVRCHVIGFGYETGYMDEQKTPNFKGVGCENCHGPGSLHVKDSKSAEYQLAMSPWKRKKEDRLPDNKVEIAIDSSTCQKCHDLDNDPYFKFKDFWPKISHGPSVKKK
jgi:hypothetical protein